jgi:hypothetical protein
MWKPADSPRCPAPPTARAGRVHPPALAASSLRRWSVWRIGVAVLLLAAVGSPAAALSVGASATSSDIDLAQYPTRYAANAGYVYTGRRAQVLHHLTERYATRVTTYAEHAECPTCSADLWTPGAVGGHDNTALQSMHDLANYLRANASKLGIKYVIWNKRYSSGGEWRKLKDQGSITANHQDHVHITFRRGFK